MYLPGMQYQDAIWRPCKSALSWAMLQACRHCQNLPFTEQEVWLAGLQPALWTALWSLRKRLEYQHNRDGNNGFELCQDLLLAWLTPGQPMPAQWWAKLNRSTGGKVAGTANLSDANLRKLAANMWSQFRDEVDVQHYIAATGEEMSVNQLQNIRKVDMADRAVKNILLNWRDQRAYLANIIGREIEAEPIEAGRIKSGARCAAQWLLNWSEHHATFAPKGKVGPFHTKSKRFTASINNLDAMLLILDGKNGPWANMRRSISLEDLLPVLQQLEQDVVPASGHSRIIAAAPDEPAMGSALTLADNSAVDNEVDDAVDAEEDNELDAELGGADQAQEEGWPEPLDLWADLPQRAPGKPNTEAPDLGELLARWPRPVQLAAWLEAARSAGAEQAALKEFLLGSAVPPEWGLRPERPDEFTVARLRTRMPPPPPNAAEFAATVDVARLELTCYFAVYCGREFDHE